MWAITTNGFVSLVEHDQNADMIRARARRIEHLQDTFDLSDAEIIDLGPNCPDYRYHADISRTFVAQKMFDAVMDVGYTSHVKESVARKDPVFYKAMMGCWRELYTLQYPAKSGMVLDQESLWQRALIESVAGTGRWGERERDPEHCLAREGREHLWQDQPGARVRCLACNYERAAIPATTPTLESMGGLVDQIEELADKMRGIRGIPVDRPAPDLLEHPGPLIAFRWTTDTAPSDEDFFYECLICGDELSPGDVCVQLPEDAEFEEPAGPAHAACAEEEGWQVQR